MAHYYNRSRSRTYVYCVSLESSRFIWNEYGGDSEIGKVCLVLDFDKLRVLVNSTIDSGRLDAYGRTCEQIFSVDYGVVDYVDRDLFRANQTVFPNPIKYTFIKDKKYETDKELRVALSALGIGEYALNGETLTFSKSLRLGFDFRVAIAKVALKEILYDSREMRRFLLENLGRYRIGPVGAKARVA